MNTITPSEGEAPAGPPPIVTDDDRYEAVRRRDRACDDVFYYAVRTTGVYCRPSCASRLALRRNVSFHASAAEARSAGFRPCQRCRPDEESQDRRHAEAVRRACRLIETAEEPPTLEALAAAGGLSPFHFHRVFKQVTGVTPKAYGDAARARRVVARLNDGGTVTQALFDAGFNASSRFYEGANHRLGMAPSTYRKGGAGEAIRFAVGACSLGAILVASSRAGICAIWFGDDPEALVRALQDRFSRADLTGGDEAFERLVARVVGFVEEPASGLDLPLDIRGTVFQQKVWKALRAIPAGRTASYAEVAAAVGAPSAVRAVAGACAANNLALAIPCHRVVRSDGALSGYRWGVERKRDLLDRERDGAEREAVSGVDGEDAPRPTAGSASWSVSPDHRRR